MLIHFKKMGFENIREKSGGHSMFACCRRKCTITKPVHHEHKLGRNVLFHCPFLARGLNSGKKLSILSTHFPPSLRVVV